MEFQKVAREWRPRLVSGARAAQDDRMETRSWKRADCYYLSSLVVFVIADSARVFFFFPADFLEAEKKRPPGWKVKRAKARGGGAGLTLTRREGHSGAKDRWSRGPHSSRAAQAACHRRRQRDESEKWISEKPTLQTSWKSNQKNVLFDYFRYSET